LCEVAAAAAKDDRDVAVAGDFDDERDLVLEAEFGVALPVERECVQLLSGHDVGEAVGPCVAGAGEAGDQRVLVRVLGEALVHSPGERGAHDDVHVVWTAADLVDRHPVAWDDAVKRGE
jgi:hypothetical protein